MKKTQYQIAALMRPMSKSPIDPFHLAQARITRKALAEALDVNYQTLSGWMGGYVNWKLDKLTLARQILSKCGVKI